MTEPTASLVRRIAAPGAGGIAAQFTEARRREDLVDAARIVLADGSEAERAMTVTVLSGPAAHVGAGALIGERLRHDPSARVRQLAARALEHTQAPERTALLAAALADSAAEVRRVAAQSLTRTAREVAVVELGRLAEHGNSDDRIAVLGLIHAEHLEGLLDLARAAINDPSPLVRASAARALVAHDPERVSDLLEDSDDLVRASALDALRERPRAVHAERLLAPLADPQPAVRHAALLLARERGIADVCPAVVGLLDDELPGIAQVALDTVGKLHCTQARGRLYQLAGESPSDSERAAAVRVLARLQGEDEDDGLRAFLDDPVEDVRQAALEGLSSVRERDAQRLAELLAHDDDPTVRVAAARRLAQPSATPLTIPALARALADDPDARVRRGCAKALLDHAPALVAQFRRATADSDMGVRLLAARALGDTGDASAVGTLLRLREAESSLPMIAETTAALVRLDPPRFLEEVVDAAAASLHDPAQTGRAFSIWTRESPDVDAPEQLTFYNVGIVEVVARDGAIEQLRFRVDGDELRLVSQLGETTLTANVAVTPTTIGGSIEGEGRAYRLNVEPIGSEAIGEMPVTWSYLSGA